MAAPIKIYGAPLSAPTRAVLWMALETGVNYEFVFVNISAGEQKKPEYLAKNPYGQVPLMDDNGFTLAESHAIMEYLAVKQGQYEKFYGSDLKTRSKVAEQMHHHHESVRRGHSGFVLASVVGPARGATRDEGLIADARQTLVTTMTHLNERLASHAFLCGAQPTAADMAAHCELSNRALTAGGFDYDAYPHVTRWFNEVAASPFFTKHAEIVALRDKGVQGMVAGLAAAGATAASAGIAAAAGIPAVAN